MKYFAIHFIQDESKGSYDQENIELMVASQVKKQTAGNLLSTENLDDGNREDGSFTSQQLFLFAWQIAKGMVTIIT